MFQEFFAAHIFAGFVAFGGKFAFNHHLRGDARMVCARLPEHSFPAHTVIADKDILNGVINRMTHMQAARHIGRRG